MNESLIITHLKTNSQNLEMWIVTDTDNDMAVGHIFMNVENNNTIKFLDAWVHDDYRRRGIYRMLWDKRWQHVKNNYSDCKIYAWCKDTSLPIFEEKGFIKGEIATYVETRI